MTRNIWIGVVVVVLVAGGWWYLDQSSVPATSATNELPTLQENTNTGTQVTTKPTPTPQAPKPTTPLTRENVKVGDKVGGFVVTDIKVIALPSGDPKKDLRINFSGEAAITGTYAVGGFSGPDEVSITVSKTDNPQLPYFLLDSEAREVTISLSNSSSARQSLTGNSGKAVIKIKNLSAAWATGTEAVTTAEFASVASASNSGPAPSTSAPSSKTYSSSQHGFSFQYPTSLVLETTGLSSGGLQGSSAAGVVSMYITISNVIDRLTVSASSDSTDVSNCMIAPNSPDPTGEHAANVSTVNINGVSFLRYQLSDLAAGQSVSITAYHTVRNNTCYEMRDMVSSTASNRLSAEENQQQSANIAAASAIILPIVQSFRFN